MRSPRWVRDDTCEGILKLRRRAPTKIILPRGLFRFRLHTVETAESRVALRKNWAGYVGPRWLVHSAHAATAAMACAGTNRFFLFLDVGDQDFGCEHECDD